MKRLHLALIVFLVSGPYCGILPGVVYLPDILPRETDVPGWTPGELRRARGEELQRIASGLGEYEPLDMVTKDYRRVSGGDGDIRVELFRFRRPLDSFGAFGIEGGPADVTHASGGALFRSGGSLHARWGPLYIRIRSSGSGEKALDRFASVVLEKTRRAFPEDGLPDFLVAMGRGAQGGVLYRRKGLDAVPGVKEVFLLQREINGKPLDLFFSRGASVEDARRSFADLLGRADHGWHLSRAGTIQPAVRILPGRGMAFLHHHKEWLYGVLNADTLDEGSGMILDLHREIMEMTGDRADGSE